MNIALIGYGKMGKAIEEHALRKGHHIVLKVGSSNVRDLTVSNLAKADVAIEFTNPESAFNNIRLCIDNTLPVVSGSTGWLDRLDEIKQYCKSKNGSFIYASNFSVGVNIFFELNQKLASLMNEKSDYNVSIEEIHHTQKKDAPSGTAITLAEQIIEKIKTKEKWAKETGAENDLIIKSLREDPAPGTHRVKYHSMVDDIEIIHTAHSRDGFAAGAVLAAEFIAVNKGIFSMKDVLGI